MVELRTLGRVELTDADGNEMRAVLSQPKRVVLLAYLATSSSLGYRSRDTLRALFWPGLDDAHARNALSQACSFLRKHVGESTILSRGYDELTIAPERLDCDAVAFQHAIDRDELAAASALYRGDFLEGVFVSDASVELETWLERERTRLRHLATQAEVSLSERALREGDVTAARRRARMAVALSPDDEQVQRQLITVLACTGQRLEALKVYDAFAKRLEREYDALPSSETRAAVHAARHAENGEDDVAARAYAAAPVTAERLVVAAGKRNRIRTTVSIAVGGILAVGAVWSAEHLPAHTRVDANRVAVAPFEIIGTRDVELREGVLDLLSASLDGTGPLRAVPVSRVLKIWPGRADSSSLATFARETRAGLVIHGRVVGVGGDSVRVSASLLDAFTGGTREFEFREAAARIDRIADTLALRMLRDLGRTRPIGAVRAISLGSTSYPAMRAFLRGEQFFRRNLGDSATANYARAAELDPQFALAWRRLGAVRAWGRWETDSLVVLYRSRAARLNVGLPARESLLVVADSLYQALIEQNNNVRWAEHHRRLHETLLIASSRYPDDPEVWCTLGIVRTYFPRDDEDVRAAFGAFDRALALDSAYLPAYEHPALLSLYFDQPDDAWRYVAARRRHDSAYAASEGARLVERLVDPELRSDARHTIIARASVSALSDAAFALDYWRDSTETNVLLQRELLRRKSSTQGDDRQAYVEALFQRGHPAAALAVANGDLAGMSNVVLMHLALVGAISADVVNARIEKVLATGRMSSIGLPLWAATRDTARIVSFEKTVRAQTYPPGERAVSQMSFERSRRYNIARAAAYLSLARADSFDALHHFTALASPDCSGCAFTALRIDRLILAQLLSKKGRDREAFSLISNTSGFGIAPSVFDIQQAIELGRIAQRLGERDRAIRAYQFVVHSWPHPDPPLIAYVSEASAALRTLTLPGARK